MTSPTPSIYRVAFAGRPMRQKSTPREWISTPELQVFSQILDTLVARSPNGNMRPRLAQFVISPDQTTLKLNWAGRSFDDGSPILADEVTSCLIGSCWKFESLIPESRHWFTSKLKVVGTQEIHFTELGPQEAQRILKHLALPDFGIHKIAHAPLNQSFAGSGPYRIRSEAPEGLFLEPNPHHPDVARTISNLEFVTVAPENYADSLAQGKIDEYFHYGTIPSAPPDSNRPVAEHIPSTHAAVGLLLFNTHEGVFKDLAMRVSFSNLLAQAIRDGFADSSWASPRSITPPGFEGHGAVDYLDLSKIGDQPSTDHRTITIAVTNTRQKRRIESLFRHPAFACWDPSFVVFNNYRDLQESSKKNSGTPLDLAFIAVRSDTLLSIEFFDFLNQESATCLFKSNETHSACELKTNPSTTISNLEAIARDEALCFPIGYYFTIRAVSARPDVQLGEATFEDSPRYLRINEDQLASEWAHRRIKLEQYWRYAFDRRSKEMIYAKTSRAIHDLKSPLALLSAIAHGEGIDSNSASLIQMARCRIDEIIQEILPDSNHRPKEKRLTVFDSVKPRLLLTQVIEEIRAYTPKNIRFELEAPEIDSEIRLPRIGLYSIAANLIKNATEALKEQANGTIHIAIKSSNTLDLVIQDNGPGFTAAAIDAIESGIEYSSKPQGSGVGLKQAITAIRATGGGLTLKNNQNGGAEIRVSVPKVNA